MKEAAGSAATVGGTACTQQFIGHFSEPPEAAIMEPVSFSNAVMPSIS
jgi:hypothetical protein